MAAQFSTRFIRVGANLINIEAIQRVHLKQDGSAEVLLTGPRKAVQRLLVPKPHGREIFEFVHTHLSVGDFGEAVPYQSQKQDEKNREAKTPKKKRESAAKKKDDKKKDE